MELEVERKLQTRMGVALFWKFILGVWMVTRGCSSWSVQRGPYRRSELLRGTYTEARQACRSIGPDWDLPNDILSEQDLEGIKETWLVFQKKSFSNFTWMNGVEFPVRHKEAGGFCAGLAVALEDIQSIPCREKGVGYICQIPSGKSCPKYFSYTCLPFDGLHFVVGCGVHDWYDAESLCMSFGGHLAILDRKVKIKRILNFINSKSLFDKCGWSFAGLRKEEWQAAVAGGVIRPSKLSWTESSTDDTKMCLIYDTVRKAMEITDCDSQHEVLCQSYNLSKTAHLNFHDKDTSSYKVTIAILALFPSLIILTAVAILFLSRRIGRYPFSEEWRKKSASEISAIASYHKKQITSCAISKRCRKERKNRHHETSTGIEAQGEEIMVHSLLEAASQETEVQLETLPGEEKDKDVQSATAVKAMSSKQMSTIGYQPPKILPKSVIRIIMFSSGVDSTLPNYENANITNIVWEPSKNKEKFSGNEEAITAVQTFESLTGHSLSAINIITPLNAKENCINLDGDKENQLIAFLDTNCDQNLVIFLPLLGHHQFCNLDNLKKILSLRRKAVVVTIAKMMPKFPTTEIITAIGEVMDEEQFKVADITVPVYKHGKTKSKIEKEGAAKVVGLAAALLHAGCNQTSGVEDRSSFVWRAMVAYIEEHPNLFKSPQLDSIQAEHISDIMKRVTEDQEHTFKIVRGGAQGIVTIDSGHRIKIAFILEKQQRKWYESEKKNVKLIGDYFRWKSEEPVELKDASLSDEVDFFMKIMIHYNKEAYNFIHITVYEIDTGDINCLTHVSKILNSVREFSIVYQTCVKMNIPDDHPVMKNALYVQKYSVFLSAAKARTKDKTPEFPSTLSIAVGTNEPETNEQLLGSTLDFVCKEENMEKAAVSVAVLIVLFLQEVVKVAELDKNRFNSICTTPVMQRILREMCSHPHQHQLVDGWGVLDLKDAIQTKIMNHHELRRLSSVDPKAIYWNGKNM